MSLLNEISVRWTVRERPSLWSYILLTRQNIINLDPQKCTSIQKGFISWVELQIQEFTVKIFYETSRSRDNLVTNHMTTSRDTILIYTCTYPRNFCQRRIWIKTRWLIGNIRTSFNKKWKCSFNRAPRTVLLHVCMHDKFLVQRTLYLVEGKFQLLLMVFDRLFRYRYQHQNTQAVIRLQQDVPFELHNVMPMNNPCA